MSDLYKQFVIKRRKPEISWKAMTHQKKVNYRSKH